MIVAGFLFLGYINKVRRRERWRCLRCRTIVLLWPHRRLADRRELDGYSTDRLCVGLGDVGVVTKGIGHSD